MWYRDLLIYYAVTVLSVTAHELAHLVVAMSLEMRNLELYLGPKLFRIRIGRLHISPFIISGGVEMDGEAILEQRSLSIIILFMSGPVMSLVLLIISLLMPSSVLQYALFSVNIGCLIFSLFPVFLKNNDMASLIQYIRVKKYRVMRSRSVAIAGETDDHDPKKDA